MALNAKMMMNKIAVDSPMMAKREREPRMSEFKKMKLKKTTFARSGTAVEKGTQAKKSALPGGEAVEQEGAAKNENEALEKHIRFKSETSV